MIPNDLAIKATNWWAQHLRSVPLHDAGDTMLNTALSGIQIEPLSDDKIIKFASALHFMLTDERISFQYNDLMYDPVTIRVDYKPDLILQHAAKVAGFDTTVLRFPVKTIMWIHIADSKMEVSQGYGAPIKEL